MTLACPSRSHVSSDSISHCFRTKDGLAALQKNRSRLQSVTPEYALRLDASISYEFRDRNYLQHSRHYSKKESSSRQQLFPAGPQRSSTTRPTRSRASPLAADEPAASQTA